MLALNFLLSATISAVVWMRSAGDLPGVSVDHISRDYWEDKERRKCDALKLSVCPAADSVPACGFLSVSAFVPHYGNFIGDWTLLLDSSRVPVRFSSVSVNSNRSATGVKIVPLDACPRVVRVVSQGGKYAEFVKK